ncbi:transmembrane protein 208 isoform X2 [Venturia canescens]|nr:transmembrane protein 208 isoform X2 [Venturia canescens]
MVFAAVAIYLTTMMVFFQFNALEITLTIFSALAYLGSYQFMMYMARTKYSETGQLLDSGVDLNMDGGIAENFKDLIILTAGVQVLSLTSNYFWLLWLLAPIRALWMLWSKLLAPWFFSGPQEQPEMDEKKQRKMERKMAKRH